jgi:pimeloyl-ACP methyl ester carboxylesterase
VVRAVQGTAAPLHVAFSMGVTVVLELFRHHPELVRAAALIAGAPQGPFATLPGVAPALRGVLELAAPAVPRLAPLLRRLLRSRVPYPLGRALGVLQRTSPRQDIDQMMEGVAQMDPMAFFDSVRGLMRADASDVLPRLTIPLLVVAARRDLLMPLGQVRRMRAALPGAEYLEIADAGHAGLVEEGPRIGDAVALFLNRVGENRA